MLKLLGAVRVELLCVRLDFVNPLEKFIFLEMELLLCHCLGFPQMAHIDLDALSLHISKQLSKWLPVTRVDVE